MLNRKPFAVFVRLCVFNFFLFSANLSQGALICTETQANIPVNLQWAGASPNDVSTLNGSTSTPGHLQGRLKQCIPDGSVAGEQGTFEWLPPVAGDSAFFVGEINGPNSVALNGPDFNFVSIRMGNANFTGSLLANDVVIQEYLLDSKMNFNGVTISALNSILIDSNDGEEIPDQDLTVKFEGGGLTAVHDINIGALARAVTKLDMTGSTLNSDTLSLQPSFDGGGFLDMTFTSGQSEVARDVMIGQIVNGETNLTIDGSQVNWAGASGFTTIGHSGDVNVKIKGGSDVSTHETFMAFQPESNVEMTIDGSKWTAGNLVIGGFGDATVTANTGAELASKNTTIGSFPTTGTTEAIVTLNGNAKWDIDGFLTVGSQGKGTLILNDDSTINVFGLTIIGVLDGSDGQIDVHSGNTLKVTETFEVGRSGDADLNIFQGGHVDVGGDLFVGTFQTGNGDIAIDGGLLTVDGNVNISNGSPGVTNDNGFGDIRIENGGTLEFGSDKQLRIGRREGTHGSLSIFGADSKVIGGDAIAQGIQVGLDGEGDLGLFAGATLGDAEQDLVVGINEKGAGNIGVVNNGSLLRTDNLILGDRGQGTGIVLDGGKIEVASDLTIGKISKGVNKLEVHGTGSRLEVGGELTIGDEGNGELELKDGGVLDMQGFNSKITLGELVGSSGKLTLNGSGPHLASDTEIIIGDEGLGELHLENGAQLTMDDVILGNKPTSLGHVFVKGQGSLFEVQNSLIVSRFGGGAILVAEGGALKTSTVDANAKSILASEESSPTAVITIDGEGSKWTAGDIVVGQKANGLVNVRAGGNVDTKNLVLGEEQNGFGEINIEGKSGNTPSEVTYSELTVGKNGRGNIVVSQGGLLQGKDAATQVFLGDDANSSGTVSISDDGSRWIVGSEQGLVLGVFGQGTVDIKNGGVVELEPEAELILGTLSSTSKGTITVDGVSAGDRASQLLTGSSVVIGRLGEGHVDILNGGEFKAAEGVDVTTEVGTQSGSKGIVNVEGEDSIWAPGDVTIGGDGVAQVTVKDLAIINSNNVVIQGNTTSETMVTVHNAEWDLFNFDMEGDSRLNIEGTAGVSTFTVHGDSTVQGTGAGTPLVTVDGNFAQYDASNADVFLDHATMLVNNGAGVKASNMIIDGSGLFHLQNNSFAEISNTMIVNRGLAQVGVGSVVDVEKNLQIGTLGTVDVTQGGVVNVGFNNIGTPNGTVSVTSGGTLSGSGTIKGDLFVGGETQLGFGNGGKVLPGNSPGKLTIDGNFFLDTGAFLDLEVAGTLPGDFDQLDVLGFAEFAPGSIVEFSFLNDYLPKAGDTFSFITAQNGVNGLSNDNFRFKNIDPSFLYDIKTDNGHFTLAALNDGQISTPEPTTMALMFSGLAGMFWYRHRKGVKS